MTDPFDLWWQWAEKPHESLLMIDAEIKSVQSLTLGAGGLC
jgi:hypothetical protein